ncbi:hypothetical protein EV140_0101 [Microcella alkaliphila]|uniref:Glycoside hydrolase family 127 protein n=1 Tax=Microcella alkaliphila TaxID=279828 RepID=A0A4Q7U0N1_9MICO|nr:beta-L-arabinofuranosidase domain-containing protein [Microcella alkaliphila]RZT66427.1 hypothetical protein EV140_0101 [Microcella alkaliphila]
MSTSAFARTTIASPVSPSRGVLSPVGSDAVRISGGFWADLQSLNASTMIAHCDYWMERLGWIGNFDAAVEGRLPDDRRGREFSDSDVYKLLEAMAWELGRQANSDLEQRYSAIVARIARVQEADGYLNTMFGRPGQAPRYSDLEWGHELYCYGHLMQAAVARARTAGEDELVRIARRAADHVCEVFGEGGIESVCGHAEIEPALIEFGRLLGEQRYVDQARLFLERRGTQVLEDIEFGRQYFQDDVTVRDAEVLRGHAVRATYLLAGAIDLAIEDDDDELLSAAERQMRRTLARRTYITGGMGSHHEGESFGADFELPSERAYSETCAGIGSIMANHRLLLATGDSFFADQVERALFNVVATSPSEDGRSFFYTNTLHRSAPGVVAAADEVSPRAAASLRAPWFAVSCCPTNVARTVASLGAYVAMSDGQAVYLAQYVAGEVSAETEGGEVILDVDTSYPSEGVISFTVTSAPSGGAELVLRVPGWAGGATVQVDGEASSADPGWARIARRLTVGDRVVLTLPMATRVSRADQRIDGLRNQVAFERGPVVLCVERLASEEFAVDDLRVAGEPRDTVDGPVLPVRAVTHHDAEWPFGAAVGASPSVEASVFEVPLIPYHRWGNRGPSTMRVWMPVG